MKLSKIISGLQTGVDQTALIEAKKAGFETGGTAPFGWRTEDGPAEWGADYGLVMHHQSSYVPRTIRNVADAEVTVWFGKTSPGHNTTKSACYKLHKPFYPNPTEATLAELADKFEVWNMAGNRASMDTDGSAQEACKGAIQFLSGLKVGG